VGEKRHEGSEKGENRTWYARIKNFAVKDKIIDISRKNPWDTENRNNQNRFRGDGIRLSKNKTRG